MQSNSLPFPLIPLTLFNGAELSEGGFELSRYLFLGSLLFSSPGGTAGGMDLSKVGEKIFSSVRSARSLGLLPASPSDRPEVPARAAAAAAVARVLAALPPHQRHSLSSSSEELSSIYGSRPSKVLNDLEEEFYEEDFDPVRHVLEHIPTDENELAYFEEKAASRLAQLDRIAERLSRHVMQHHEVMVKGMNLVRELERDLKVANVICMNGRRHLTSSRNEISRDLIVHRNSKKKQALLDMLPILTELRHALDMQAALETLVEEGNFSKAFQVLSEYLQILDSLSQLSAVQEMSHGVEVWLGKTLQKLDALLLGVCQDFQEESYITVVDAYALIGDVSGLAEKIQSFFMQEVLSDTHSVLKTLVQTDFENTNVQGARLTYSDLCIQMPESKFRQCLLATLAVLFKLMCSYHAILSFQPVDKILCEVFCDIYVSACQTLAMDEKQGEVFALAGDIEHVGTIAQTPVVSSTGEMPATCVSLTDNIAAFHPSNIDNGEEVRDGGETASSSGSPWFQLRKDAATFVSQTLHRGRRNLWQLTTSRVAVLLSSPVVCSTSIHQFLTMYEDLNTFILAGEAFCASEAVEFRQKVKFVCESYFVSFHRQNIYALKLVLEKENWLILPPEVTQIVSFAGLVGDGAALIASTSNSLDTRLGHAHKSKYLAQTNKRSGFSNWLKNENPFLVKLNSNTNEHTDSYFPGSPREVGSSNGSSFKKDSTQEDHAENNTNGSASLSEDENEDLHADFIDEDSQLPSRISKPSHSRHRSALSNDEEMTAQTGSSLTLLRLMDKYARLMQKLEFVNVELFKGISQLFGIFFHFVFESFVNQSALPGGKVLTDMLPHKLKTALSRITQDCDQWMKPQSSPFNSSSPTSSNTPFAHMDVTPTSPPSLLAGASFSLKERCAGADTISLVARLLHRSKSHLQSMLPKKNSATVEDVYVHLVDAVPDLVEHIHRTTARLFLHINGYVDRIANAKWELKDLGLEHNGYVDLLLGEFKHYKTRLVTGGIQKEVQDLLLEYGLDNVAEILVEGLSRVKRCTDEGRALMSLDLQVLINGLKHFVPIDVRPKLQIVETFIKAYYLPETEFVHWSRGHPEYSKSQVVGLVNLVATMKGWKRKTRLEVLEKIE
ncbi:PREDICTED: syndetin isoform X3 [Ipomoea nil]|uniref:syndetin isoform X3 n=1 Tax=Ipomoea nil TaxID=35883 RepID=UPI0009010273|nr:PREDICTED: syndetin isoform X3 [Ipomoea nil]